MTRPVHDTPLFKEPPDFSLVLGGPLYQLWRRTRLEGGTLQLLNRRILVLAGITWIPLLLLSVLEGHAWRWKGAGVSLPFFYDIETHARLLVALPLLIVAELIVNQRMRPVVRQFVERGLVSESDRPRFDAAILWASRLRNSVIAEVSLIATVYVVGLGIWRTQVALDVASWYGTAMDGSLHPTLAGWWMGLISLPVFQFLLLRWYFRLFIWARFLWRVSRLKLSLVPTHPDRCGGLGFLSSVCYAFAPLLLAQGSLLAGLMANRIFFAGAALANFKFEIIALVSVMVAVVLGPLVVFAPQLEAAKRQGLRDYGILAHRYVREFERKWIRGDAAMSDEMLGSGDFQSLADLGNSYEVVRGMRVSPFNLRTVVQLAVLTLLPLVPLTLTMFSLEQLMGEMLKLVF